MKRYIFPLFITALGFLTAYVFYALWHSEGLNPPKVLVPSKKKIIEDLSSKISSPKKLYVENDVSSLTRKDQYIREENITFQTNEESELLTTATYESLIPENHDEITEAADIAFEEVEGYVMQIDQDLQQEQIYDRLNELEFNEE